MSARRVSLKRDFAERSGGRGFGPGGKRQDTTGAQGRLVYISKFLFMEIIIIYCDVFHLEVINVYLNVYIMNDRLWSRVVVTQKSLDEDRPSRQLDSDGDEDEDDASKVMIAVRIVRLLIIPCLLKVQLPM